ncbi:MAG: hypothetical protein H6737_12415 [Alphaproteobacteria bacterium]|nr:hypothetical protein [Alphaproteobacteria bacterium]
MLSLILTTALGSDLVLFGDGVPPVSVLAKVSAATGKNAGEFELMSIRDWTKGIPTAFAGGTLRVCEGLPVSRAVVEQKFEEASQAVKFFDADRATGAFAELEDLLPCANEVIPREIVGRAFFLKGFVEYTSGAEADAAASYANARSIDRLMRFDGAISPDSRDLFEEANPNPAVAWVEIRPKPDRVWLDGEQVTYGDQGFQVALGRHYVTIESISTVTADLVVEQDGALILPTMIGPEIMGQVDDPRRRSAFLQMLAYAGVERAYLSDLENVWIAERNKNSIKKLGAEEPTIKEPKRRGRFTPAGLGVAGAGLVVGGVGGVLFATCDDCTGPAIGLMGGGGAVMATGLGIVIADQVSVGPTFGPRQWGVSIGAPF